ncbi:hypothetical protein LSTR_LSTR017150, partial [Laodelphax striatellus]
MAPNKKSSLSDKKVQSFDWKQLKILLSKYCNKTFFLSTIFDPKYLRFSACILLVAEIVLNIFVVNKVKYTEIDWIAYMQEVEGVINGTLDYSQLKGDTGPLVYPAGFVYIYTVLYYLTESGTNIRIAQYIFCVFYILTLTCIFRIYHKTGKVPPYAIIISCCTSYRIHSIFVLRMFNDPVAMLILYLSINMFIDGRWSIGSLLFSLAVSVKMNILLFSPALLLAYLYCLGLIGTIKQLSICASLQLLLGLPFLLTNPWAYLKGSFDIGRVFLFEWTVNWRFLPEDVFVNRYFHILLLIVHILLLLLFFDTFKTCLKSYANLKQIEKEIKPQLRKTDKIDMNSSSQLLVLPLFTANLIGVACSRSLHYQFYIWYFHTLPYLLWCTPYTNVWRLIYMGLIELCWNTYPSTFWSSACLHVVHVSILYGLYKNRPGKGCSIHDQTK